MDGIPEGQGLQRQIIRQQKGKLATRSTNEFTLLYHICATDGHFREREPKAPGYLDGIYILDWAVTGGGVKRDVAVDPQDTWKRASGDKEAIQFKGCSNQLDLNQQTFRAPYIKASIMSANAGSTRSTTATSRPCCGRRRRITG